MGPEPSVGITPITVVRTEVRFWANKQHLKHWHNTVGCRQVKMFIDGAHRQLSRFTLGFNRRELKRLVGLLTGHTALKRRPTIMKIRTDALCSACGEEGETHYHFLGKYSARMLDRMSVFRSYLYWSSKIYPLYGLQEPLRGFNNLRLHRGSASAHWAELIRPQRWADDNSVRPEGKVR